MWSVTLVVVLLFTSSQTDSQTLSEEQETVATLILNEFPSDHHETALSVAWCESRLGWFQQYPLKLVFNPNKKGAAGVFQFIPSTWKSHTGLAWNLAANNLLNVRAAVTLQERYGWSQWSCWSLGCDRLGDCHMGATVTHQLKTLISSWVDPNLWELRNQPGVCDLTRMSGGHETAVTGC